MTDKNVDESSKRWEEVQKRAFLHWVNSQLSKIQEKIDSLEDGFSSGVKLIALLELLTGKQVTMKYSKSPKLRVHKINNCFIALKFLQEECGVKGLTISAENLVGGEPMTQILGFCWMLLRNYQGVAVDQSKGQSFEQGLLNWLKEKLSKYNDIKLDDGFKSESFTNGKVILGLINEYDSNLINYSSYNTSDKVGNCTTGLKIGEEKVNVPALMDANELAAGKVSEKNLVLYLSLWFNAFKELDAGVSKDSLLKRIKELEELVRKLKEENDALREKKDKLEVTVEELTTKLQKLQEEHDKLKSTHEETIRELQQLKATSLQEKNNLELRVSELTENIKALQANSGDTVSALQSKVDEITRERDSLKEDLKNLKDQHAREKKELEEKNALLQADLNKSRKMREELEEIMKKQQENHSKSIHVLRKHLLQHVHDMHVWKVFLEQDRMYDSEDLHIAMEKDLESLPFHEQIQTLDEAITEENNQLERLLKEREMEAAEIVSVNIGKKKHRIKKGLEAEHAAQKEKDTKSSKKK